MSLPPESQQLVGSALDPADPRTSLFMAGSENLPQPFTGTYTYNPNLSPKSSRAMAGQGIAQTLAPERRVKIDTVEEGATTATSEEGLYGQGLYTPTGFEYGGFFEGFAVGRGNNGSGTRTPGELFEGFEDGSFVNWDQ